MNKPRWIGPDTPEIVAILDGRTWDELDAESRQRIEAAVAARPESVRLRGAEIHGTRKQVSALRESALWAARRRIADASDSGVIEWSGRDHKPELPQVVPARGGAGSYHLTSADDQVTEIGGVEVRVVPPPRAKPTGRPPGRPTGRYGLDLSKAKERTRVEAAWKTETWRTLQTLAGDVGVKAATLRKAIERAGLDVDVYLRTGRLIATK